MKRVMNEKVRVNVIKYSMEIPVVKDGNWHNIHFETKQLKAFYFPLAQIILEENGDVNGSCNIYDKYEATNGSDAYVRYLELKKCDDFEEESLDLSRAVLSWVDSFYRAKSPPKGIVDLL